MKTIMEEFAEITAKSKALVKLMEEQYPTVCEYDGTASTYNCAREEQCDDCFMIDHQKECGWCTEYDHTARKLTVKHL